MQKVSKEILKELDTSKNIIIIISRPVDYDCLASGVVLKRYLQEQKKEVVLVAPESIPKSMRWLPCLDQIEKVNTKKVNFFNYDLVLALDGGNTKQFAGVSSDEEFNFGGFPNVLNIDHHFDNAHFAPMEIWDPEKSSTAEIVLNTLVEVDFLNEVEATLLYAAFVYDTGNFMYHITPNTLHLASKLLEKGAEYKKVVNKIFYNFSQKEFEVFAWLVENSEVDKKLGLNYVVVNKKKLAKQFDASQSQVQEGINLFKSYYARALEGVSLGAIVKDFGSRVSISIRGKDSENKIPIPQISKKMGYEGGGHFHAGSVSVKGKVGDVVDQFLKAIRELKLIYKKKMKKSKRILAIQTVEIPSQIGIFDTEGKNLLAEIKFEQREETIEKLKPGLVNMLGKLKIQIDDINLVSVCTGPGSYTGTRGGIAFAKGICQMTNIPLVGVSAFEIFEFLLEGVKNYITLLDARNQRVYFKKSWEKKPGVGELDKVLKNIRRETVLVGSATKRYKEEICAILGSDASVVKDELGRISLVALAEAGVGRYKKDPSMFSKSYLLNLKPLYILPPNITKKKIKDENK